MFFIVHFFFFLSWFQFFFFSKVLSSHEKFQDFSYLLNDKYLRDIFLLIPRTLSEVFSMFLPFMFYIIFFFSHCSKFVFVVQFYSWFFLPNRFSRIKVNLINFPAFFSLPFLALFSSCFQRTDYGFIFDII